MVMDAKTILQREINRYRRVIARKASELQSLDKELRRHEQALELLADNRPMRARRKPVKTRRRSQVNWNSVLGRLPNSFTIKDIAGRPELKQKSPVYIRQIVARWAKEGKTKRTAPGKYQKVEQKQRSAA